MVLVLGLRFLFRYATDWPLGVKIGAQLAVYLVLGFLVFVFKLVPNMEMLPPGGQPKYQRWKSRILAAAGALLIGVIGSIIAAAVWS